MKNWEKALYKFLNKYEKLSFFEGAILCGSYATGNQNNRSDIDINIIISNTQDWCERGYIYIDGFLIEYAINPFNKIKQEFRKDYLQRGSLIANLFAHGKILFDTHGKMHSLQKDAISLLNKTPSRIHKKDLLWDYYHIWNDLDELHVLSSEKREIALVYYDLLTSLWKLYFKAKGIPLVPLAKIEKILTDKTFAKRCYFTKKPNKKFTTLFLNALYHKNLKEITRFHDYVINELGGFDIGSFKTHNTLK